MIRTSLCVALMLPLIHSSSYARVELARDDDEEIKQLKEKVERLEAENEALKDQLVKLRKDAVRRTSAPKEPTVKTNVKGPTFKNPLVGTTWILRWKGPDGDSGSTEVTFKAEELVNETTKAKTVLNDRGPLVYNPPGPGMVGNIYSQVSWEQQSDDAVEIVFKQFTLSNPFDNPKDPSKEIIIVRAVFSGKIAGERIAGKLGGGTTGRAADWTLIKKP